MARAPRPGGPVPGLRAACRRPAVLSSSSGQMWQLLPRADRRWLALGVFGLLGASLLQLAVPPLAAAALLAASRGQQALPQVQSLGLVALGVAAMNGLRSFSFHLTRLSFVEALREKTFDCYL
ncbi:unnamed protein product, partial [Effrenium voratum]